MTTTPKALFKKVQYLDGSKEEVAQPTRGGKAHIEFTVGDTFEGELVQSAEVKGGFVWSGHGVYLWHSGAKYEGSYENCLRHGEGTYTYPDGECYKGQWEKGKKSGSGKYTYKNGDFFLGRWVNDKREGKGKFINVGKNMETTGEWHEGTFLAKTGTTKSRVLDSSEAQKQSPAAETTEAVATPEVKKEPEVTTPAPEVTETPEKESPDSATPAAEEPKSAEAETPEPTPVVEKTTEESTPVLDTTNEETDQVVEAAKEAVAPVVETPEPAAVEEIAPPKATTTTEVADETADEIAALQAAAAPATTEAPKKQKPLGVIISGAPASGKGTQCEMIKEAFGLVHLSTGDMLRAAVEAKTEAGLNAKEFMDKGELVPDEIVIAAVVSALQAPEVVEKGFLLDGFPRTITQAEELKKAGVNVDLCLLLNVDHELLVKRAVGRRMDPETKKIYHLEFNPPPEGLLDTLIQRDDDTEEKMKTRLEKYEENIKSLKEFYAGCLKEVDGAKEKEQVWNDLEKIIKETKEEN